MAALKFLGLVIGTLLLTGLAGRGLAGLLRLRWLCRLRLETLLCWPFVGIAVWILAYGSFAYLGFSARQITGPILIALSALALLGLLHGKLWRRPAWSKLRPATLAWLGLICLMSLTVWLRGYTVCRWPSIACDTRTYAFLAEHLQEHGFPLTRMSREATRAPADFDLANYREGLRMGSTWLLASWRAAMGRDALSLYQPLMGLALVLNLLGLFLFARIVFRLPIVASLAALLLAAAPLSPLNLSIKIGFQPQLFGTAYFLLALSLLARAWRPSRWTWQYALVLGLAGATLLSVYSELMPVLLACASLAMLVVFLRSHARPRLLRFLAVAAGFLLLLGNIEWFRACRAFEYQISHPAGWPIRWDVCQYVLFGFGLRSYEAGAQPASWFAVLLVMLVAGTALTGLITLIRARRGLALGTLVVFALLALYYGMTIAAPSAEPDPRWCLFKLAKWAFPVLSLLGLACLHALTRSWKMATPVLFLPGLAVLIASFVQYPTERLWALHGWNSMTAITPRPDLERIRLHQCLADRQIDRVFYLSTGQDYHAALWAAYIFHPWPHRNGWREGHLAEVGSADQPCAVPARTLVAAWHSPPFDAGVERLPFGLIRLETSRPHVFDLEPRQELHSHPDGGVWMPLSPVHPTILHLFSPHEATGILRLRFETGDAQADGWTVQIRCDRRERMIRVETNEVLELTVPLPAGRSQLELTACSPRPLDRLKLRHAEVVFEASSTPTRIGNHTCLSAGRE